MKYRAGLFVCTMLLTLGLTAVSGVARAEAVSFLPAAGYATGASPS